MTAINVAFSKKKKEEIAELRKMINCKIGVIDKRQIDMRASFETQKNVNRTVKHGVKYIVPYIEHVEENHEEIIGKETAYSKR